MGRLSGETSRLNSLDILRGATVAAMILVNTPGSMEESYPQLLHARWHGWTFADVIFPFFLWIMGVALALSTARRVQLGETRTRLLTHAVFRSLLLFCFGVLLAAFQFPLRKFPYFAFSDYLKFTGILQKIAVCYLVAFVIAQWTDWRGVILAIAGLNLAYLGFLFYYPVPGCGAGLLTPECNFPRYLDGTLLKGHMWASGAQDPDGLGAILPAISTVLFGVLTGCVLRFEAVTGRILRLLSMGLVLCAAAMLLADPIPINKQLWTTSYAFLMAGLASICFAPVYWLVDVEHQSSWLKPLQILGMNAIAAFIVSQVFANVPLVHFFGKTLYEDVCRQLFSPPNASLLYALIYLAGVYVVVWLMHRQGWWLKI